MRWRKVRNRDEWKTPEGWRIEREPDGNYRSWRPNGNPHVVWGNSLASAKRLCDKAAA